MGLLVVHTLCAAAPTGLARAALTKPWRVRHAKDSMFQQLKDYFLSHNHLEQRKWDLLVVSFYAFLACFLPYSTFDWDSYVRWAEQIRIIGFENIYLHHYVNYMPFNIYAIQLWQLICGWQGWQLVGYFQLIKIYPIIFDALTVLLLLRFAKHYRASLLTVALLFLPNIAFQYNSFIWGQFDSVYTFFCLFTVFFLLRKQPIAAVIMFLFALNSKIQAIVLLPALATAAWVLIYSDEKKWRVKMLRTLVVGGFVTLALQAVFLLPFSGTPPLQILTLVLQRSVSLSNYITFNADNFWILIGMRSMQDSDSLKGLFGLTIKNWGYLLFAVSSILTFLPLAFSALPNPNHWSKRLRDISSWSPSERAEWIALICYLQSLSFFYFFTQMHERYSHPTLVFAGLFAIISRKKSVFFITCLAYLINLEQINKYWAHVIDLSKISWIGQLSALLFLIGLVLAFVSLYRIYLGQVDLKRAA